MIPLVLLLPLPIPIRIYNCLNNNTADITTTIRFYNVYFVYFFIIKNFILYIFFSFDLLFVNLYNNSQTQYLSFSKLALYLRKFRLSHYLFCPRLRFKTIKKHTCDTRTISRSLTFCSRHVTTVPTLTHYLTNQLNNNYNKLITLPTFLVPSIYSCLSYVINTTHYS